MPTDPIVPKNATMEQVALHLAAQMARGLRPGGKTGPDYQTYLDFFDSIQKRKYEEDARDLNNAKEENNIAPDNRLAKKDRSPTWARWLGNISDRRSGLSIRFRGLADALIEGDAAKAKRRLGILVGELNRFAVDYANFKNTAGKALLNEHPELFKFAELWENGTFREGKEVEQVLNSALQVQEGASPGPEEKKPLRTTLLKEQAPEKEALDSDDPEDINDAGLETLNINDLYIANERKKGEEDRFGVRRTQNVYAPSKESYAGLLGSYARQAHTANHETLRMLMSKALTVAKYWKEGIDFQKVNPEDFENDAEDLRFSPGFDAMVRNKDFMQEVLTNPEKIDRALGLYQEEQEAELRGPSKQKTYKDYLRLHTWPNVPEGKETEYLAKSIAAHRLAAHGTPFDLETIRSEAEQIRKQGAFKDLTTEEHFHKDPQDNVQRWLHRENLQPASNALEVLRKEKLRKNRTEPADPRVKSWAGYRRMHTKQNVPANATPAQKRLYLAKAAVAVRGMADDGDFSVKAARKQAEKLMKNKYFLEVTKDPERVSALLLSGKVTELFTDMATARRNALIRKNPTADISIPTYEGSTVDPAERKASILLST